MLPRRGDAARARCSRRRRSARRARGRRRRLPARAAPSVPSGARIDCGVSIINSSRRLLRFSFSRRSSAAQARPTASTCAGVITFGTVIAKLSGSRLPAFTSAVTNRSSVRRLRACSSLRHRLDANADERRQRAGDHAGGDLPAPPIARGRPPRRRAACRSRPRNRGGDPRPARVSASRSRARGRFRPAGIVGRRPSTLAKADAVGANSLSVAMAAAPNICAESRAERVAHCKSACARVAARSHRPDRRRRAGCWRCAAARRWPRDRAAGSSDAIGQVPR